jgi:hypothetical protein
VRAGLRRLAASWAAAFLAAGRIASRLRGRQNRNAIAAAIQSALAAPVVR